MKSRRFFTGAALASLALGLGYGARAQQTSVASVQIPLPPLIGLPALITPRLASISLSPAASIQAKAPRPAKAARIAPAPGGLARALLPSPAAAALLQTAAGIAAGDSFSPAAAAKRLDRLFDNRSQVSAGDVRLSFDMEDDYYYRNEMSADRAYGAHKTWQAGQIENMTEFNDGLRAVKSRISQTVGFERDVSIHLTEITSDYYYGGSALRYDGYVEIEGVGREYFYSTSWDWYSWHEGKPVINSPGTVVWDAFQKLWKKDVEERELQRRRDAEAREFRRKMVEGGRKCLAGLASFIRREKISVPEDISTLDNTEIRNLVVPLMTRFTQTTFPKFSPDWRISKSFDLEEAQAGHKQPFIDELLSRRTEKGGRYSPSWLSRASLPALSSELADNRSRDAETKARLEARGLAMPKTIGEAADMIQAYDEEARSLAAEVKKRGIELDAGAIPLDKQVTLLQGIYTVLLTEEFKQKIVKGVLEPAGMRDPFVDNPTLAQMETFLKTFHNDSVREELAALRKDLQSLNDRVAHLGSRLDRLDGRVDRLEHPPVVERTGVGKGFLRWWNSPDNVAVDLKRILSMRREAALEHWLSGGLY
jgi:hypothetical protein